MTPHRRAVLDAVRESEEHLTAREILDRARAKQPRLSYATLYNALEYLSRAGLIHEIPAGSAASRYDRRSALHGHAICDACGCVADLEMPDLVAAVRTAAAAASFHLETVTLTVYGRCARCGPPQSADAAAA